MNRLIKGIYASLMLCFVLMSCDNKEPIDQIIPPTPHDAVYLLKAESSIVTIPVKAQGEWTVSIEPNTCDWIYLITTSGNGNKDLKLSVGTNLGEVMREATIRVSNATSHVDYTIRQLLDDDNSASDAQYDNSGLGYGVKMQPTEGGLGIYSFIKSYSIINFEQLGDGSVLDEPNFVRTVPYDDFKFIVKDLNTYQNEERELKASLDLNISYGLFKLGLSGNFKMYGAQQDTTKCFGAIVTYPTNILRLNYSHLTANYKENRTSPEDELYRTKRAHLFNSEFLTCHDKIEELVANNVKYVKNPTEGSDASTIELWKNLEKLNDNFGPVFIDQVLQGGNVDIDFQVADNSATDTLAIHGKLKSSFNSLFSFDVEVTADYLNDVSSHLDGATLIVDAQGGSLKTKKELIKSLTSLTSLKSKTEEKAAEKAAEKAEERTFDLDTVMNAIEKWADTIEKDKKVTNIHFETTPIWNLFSTDAAIVLKSYFKDKYPNAKDEKGKEHCPYSYNIQVLAN